MLSRSMTHICIEEIQQVIIWTAAHIMTFSERYAHLAQGTTRAQGLYGSSGLDLWTLASYLHLIKSPFLTLLEFSLKY